MMRKPIQLEPNHDLVRSWTVEKPVFYGLSLDYAAWESLKQTETALASGRIEELNPKLCRVLAACHGPKGAKVPLSLSTVSGCVRPAFIALNSWLTPNSLSCYDGGCYLFHARAVPAKKGHEHRVRAHITPIEGLLAAADASRRYGLPIRDNQSSDGSLSIGLPARGSEFSQLYLNLQTLADHAYDDVPYLCFSSAYTRVSSKLFAGLAKFKNLYVHVTVSGWHSREENNLRLQEFERYFKHLGNTFLRVVNRQDWASDGEAAHDCGAREEDWLLDEIKRRGLITRVIRTPFHSVHPFPGSSPGNLGTRHMANTNYSAAWGQLHLHGALACCTTGKCKTCATRCGVPGRATPRDPIIAARAFEAMLHFECARQRQAEVTPLAIYTARLLARKGAETSTIAGLEDNACYFREVYRRYDSKVRGLSLVNSQRHRLTNDSHALVIDGLDRHSLWASAGHDIKVGVR